VQIERAGYKNDLPGSRRAPCLGCDLPVVAARDAYIQIGGRRDGSLLVVMDVDPLVSYATDVDEIYRATDIYLLGLAHRTCRERACERLEARTVELPEELPLLLVDDEVDVDLLPPLHLPPSLQRCPFCNEPNATEEHAFPQWLSRELTTIGGLIDRTAQHLPRPLRKVGATVPVCGSCNNRWLSVLENDVRPVLTPLVRGEERQLDLREQRLLAAWASKTAMMLDIASGNPVIPAGFFQELRQQREALATQFVWIAGYGGGKWAAWVSHGGLHLGIEEREPANGFVTTFTAFRVVFQVVGHFTRGGADFNDDRIYQDALARIWPPGDGPISWPPNRIVFDDPWLIKLGESIDG